MPVSRLYCIVNYHYYICHHGLRPLTSPAPAMLQEHNVACLVAFKSFAQLLFRLLACTQCVLASEALPDLQSCILWLAKHALMAWTTRAFAQLPSTIRNDVRAKVNMHCHISQMFGQGRSST